MKKRVKQKRTKPRSIVVDEPAPKRRLLVRDVAGTLVSTLSGAKGRKSGGQKQADKPSAHILVRARAEDGLTIEAHERVIARFGAALFGKFGQPIGPEFRDSLNHQAASGQKTYLFITTRLAWGQEYTTYRCALRQVLDALPESKRHLVPSYYVGQAAYINAWFEIEGLERLSRDEMNQIYVLSSGRSITNAIFSRTAVFRVGTRNTPRG
jgi:hypothetical protein